MIETYRELAWGLLDVYLSGASNRMNEIMKVLTIISTIFIPLNFIAGVYGMNFDRQASSAPACPSSGVLGYPACGGDARPGRHHGALFHRAEGMAGRPCTPPSSPLE